MSKPVLLSQLSGDTNGQPTWLDQQELHRLITENNPKIQGIVNIQFGSEQFAKSSLRMQIQVKLAGEQKEKDYDNTVITIIKMNRKRNSNA